jgi:hypothetical protein
LKKSILQAKVQTKQKFEVLMSSVQSQKNASVAASTTPTHPQTNQTQTVTKITVKFDCGFPNNLFIRGEGLPGINWEKGVMLKNIKADEWTWETNKPFSKALYKILINDRQYECGENHAIECGKSIVLSPKF